MSLPASLGFTLLAFIFGLAAFGFLACAVHGSVGVSVLPLAVALALLTHWLLSRGQRRELWIGGLAFIAIVIGSLLISSAIIDTSFDGQKYRQEAVIALAQGWNPLWHHTAANWRLETYPKGLWMAQAALYAVTHRLEAAKAINWLALLACFFVALSTFVQSGIGRARAHILALLVSANPVSVTQLFTFYGDGVLASLITMIVLLGLRCYREGGRIFHLALAATLIVTINVKSTGAVYAACFAAGILFASGWYDWARNRRILMTTVVAAIVGAGIVGFNPYLTNWLHHGNPFYPIVGAETGPFVQRHFVIENTSPLVSLLRSLGSRCTNSDPLVTEWKIPFVVHPIEISTLFDCDVRIAGFGPWFSGALLLSLVALIAGPGRVPLGLALVGIFLSAASTSAGWWARIAPQIWLLPLCALETCYRGGRRIIGHLIAAVLAINLLLVVPASVLARYLVSHERQRELAELKARIDPRPVMVDFGEMANTRIQLAEHAIPFQQVSPLPCSQPGKLVYSTVQYCLPETDQAPPIRDPFAKLLELGHRLVHPTR